MRGGSSRTPTAGALNAADPAPRATPSPHPTPRPASSSWATPSNAPPSLTIPKDRGIFLPITWRLAPNVARFTSDLFYEGLLTSKPGLENQRLTGVSDLDGSGLHLVEVPHEGNRNSSEEEINAIAALVSRLTAGSAQWINGTGPHPAFVAGSVVGVKVKAVIAALESDGWTQVRVTGSHRQFHHPSKPGTVTVAGKPSVDLPPGTLNSVLKQAGLKK